MQSAKQTMKPNRALSHERGSVLVLALVLLVILTLLGLSGMETATLEERMAGNVRNKQLSFNAAETALRGGEAFLATTVGNTRPNATNSSPGSSEVWEDNAPDPNSSVDRFWWNEATGAWWDGSSVSVTYDADSSGDTSHLVAQQPQYLIEELYSQEAGGSLVGGYTAAPRRYFYRITARGMGKNETAETFLQTTFVRTFENE